MKPIKLKELVARDRGKTAKELIQLAKQLNAELKEKIRKNGQLD
jgi:hypothetical protein